MTQEHPDTFFVPDASEGICQAEPYILATRTDVEGWTGFALGVDLWEPHTWLVRDRVILDVDRPRTFYFGFKLSGSLQPFAPALRHSHNTMSCDWPCVASLDH